MKPCKKCGQVKNDEDFSYCSFSTDKLMPYCKECMTDNKTGKKQSLRKAINAKCKECIYDPLAGGGTWRQQVRDCTSPQCPLFNVRPK